MGLHPAHDESQPGHETSASTRDRVRFLGALALLLAWVVVLAAMAVYSADRPAARSNPAGSQLAPGTPDPADDRGP
jgi:hypothetical protein